VFAVNHPSTAHTAVAMGCSLRVPHCACPLLPCLACAISCALTGRCARVSPRRSVTGKKTKAHGIHGPRRWVQGSLDLVACKPCQALACHVVGVACVLLQPRHT